MVSSQENRLLRTQGSADLTSRTINCDNRGRLYSLNASDYPIRTPVIFKDDFSQADVNNWRKTAGTGTIARDTTQWNTGGAAMKISTSTVAAEAMEVHRYIGRRPGQNVIAWYLNLSFIDENMSNIGFYLGWRTNNIWYRLKLLHTFTTNIWAYDAGGSGAANLVTLLTRDSTENSSHARWWNILLVADFSTNKIVTVEINEQDFYSTVNGVDLRSAADANPPQDFLDFSFETTNLGGTPTASVVYVDNTFGMAVA